MGLLSFSEQSHWRAYNFATETGYSEVTVRRWFLNQWTESDRPEHSFLESYKELCTTCQENMGWTILLPLANSDEYLLGNLRVPSTDEQKDFDSLVLALATILVDSININAIRSLLPKDGHSAQHGNQLAGIQLLDEVLTACGAEDHGEHIRFLRELQALRSSGAAHRKGRKYSKVARQFGIENQNLRTVSAEILRAAVSLVDYLTVVAQKGRLLPTPPCPQS